VAGAVAALTAKPSAEAAPAAGGEARKDRIVHPGRLTSREAEDWLKTNDVTFVPHGPISPSEGRAAGRFGRPR
jgi:hypothetical protein